MNSTQLRKVLIFCGVWIVIMVVFVLFFWRPEIERLENLEEQIRMQQGVISQLKRDIEAFPDTITLQKLEAVEGNLQQVFSRIPTEEEIHEILNQIRTYSTKNTKLEILGITDMSQDKTQGKTAFKETSSVPKLTYLVIARGGAQDIIRFLYELENGLRLITIKDYTMRRLNEDGKHLVHLDVTFDVFYSDVKEMTAPDFGVSPKQQVDLKEEGPTSLTFKE